MSAPHTRQWDGPKPASTPRFDASLRCTRGRVGKLRNAMPEAHRSRGMHIRCVGVGVGVGVGGER